MPPQEPVIFRDMVEGLKRSLGKRITPELQRAVLDLGINFDDLQVAYPIRQWHGALELLSQTIAAEAPPDRRIRTLARMAVRGFVQRGVGLAALTMGRVLGPRRTLLRTARNFRSAGNFTDVETTELGPKDVKIRSWVVPELVEQIGGAGAALVEYRWGSLEEICALLNITAKVEAIELDTGRGAATFRITWP